MLCEQAAEAMQISVRPAPKKRSEDLLLSLKPLTVCFAFVLAILLLCCGGSTMQALWHAHYPEPMSWVRLVCCFPAAGTDTAERNNSRLSKAEPVHGKRPTDADCSNPAQYVL